MFSKPVSTELDPFLEMTALIRALDACGGLSSRFDIDILDECDSSNTQLMQRAEAGAPSGTVIVARRQTAGRGRRGRVWQSAPGRSLSFSLLWRFSEGVDLSGLSLMVGLALVRTLSRMGVCGLALKWPNDVLLEGRKLAGILIELSSSAKVSEERRLAAVIGIGLNLRPMPPDSVPADQAIAALSDGLPSLPDGAELMAELLAALLAELHTQLSIFTREGFAPFREEWQRYNAYADQAVQLLADFSPPLEGICRGVAEDGALLLETESGVQRIVNGEVSLRRVVF